MPRSLPLHEIPCWECAKNHTSSNKPNSRFTTAPARCLETCRSIALATKAARERHQRLFPQTSRPMKSRRLTRWLTDAVEIMTQHCSDNATRVSVSSKKHRESAAMTDLASWLRAQIPSSTDPDRLERLAREAERQAVLRCGIAIVVRQRSPSKPPAQGYGHGPQD